MLSDNEGSLKPWCWQTAKVTADKQKYCQLWVWEKIILYLNLFLIDCTIFKKYTECMKINNQIK